MAFRVVQATNENFKESIGKTERNGLTVSWAQHMNLRSKISNLPAETEAPYITFVLAAGLNGSETFKATPMRRDGTPFRKIDGTSFQNIIISKSREPDIFNDVSELLRIRNRRVGDEVTEATPIDFDEKTFELRNRQTFDSIPYGDDRIVKPFAFIRKFNNRGAFSAIRERLGIGNGITTKKRIHMALQTTLSNGKAAPNAIATTSKSVANAIVDKSKVAISGLRVVRNVYGQRLETLEKGQTIGGWERPPSGTPLQTMYNLGNLGDLRLIDDDHSPANLLSVDYFIYGTRSNQLALRVVNGGSATTSAIWVSTSKAPTPRPSTPIATPPRPTAPNMKSKLGAFVKRLSPVYATFRKYNAEQEKQARKSQVQESRPGQSQRSLFQILNEAAEPGYPRSRGYVQRGMDEAAEKRFASSPASLYLLQQRQNRSRNYARMR